MRQWVLVFRWIFYPEMPVALHLSVYERHIQTFSEESMPQAQPEVACEHFVLWIEVFVRVAPSGNARVGEA